MFQAPPVEVAKKVIALFKNNQGSAEFTGVLPIEDTVAEIPEKRNLTAEEKQMEEHWGEQLLNNAGTHFRPPNLNANKDPNPRHHRPLFDFKHVSHRTNAVGLRKHFLKPKHRQRILKFVHKSAEKENGAKTASTRSSESSLSASESSLSAAEVGQDINYVGLVSSDNLFIFDDQMKPLYPPSSSVPVAGPPAQPALSGQAPAQQAAPPSTGGAAPAPPSQPLAGSAPPKARHHLRDLKESSY